MMSIENSSAQKGYVALKDRGWISLGIIFQKVVSAINLLQGRRGDVGKIIGSRPSVQQCISGRCLS